MAGWEEDIDWIGVKMHILYIVDNKLYSDHVKHMLLTCHDLGLVSFVDAVDAVEKRCRH